MDNRNWAGLPMVIFGIGGCAREIALLINDINSYSRNPIYKLLGLISHRSEDIGKQVDSTSIVSSNEQFSNFAANYPMLGVCFGLADPATKEHLEQSFARIPNLLYPNLVHPHASIPHSSDIRWGHGVVVCSGVNMTTNITIGNHVLLNRSCNLGHDSSVGHYSTINPGAIVSGNVQIGDLTLVGAGAVIREKTIIGRNSIVGMGAVVINEVEEGTVVFNKAAEFKRYTIQEG